MTRTTGKTLPRTGWALAVLTLTAGITLAWGAATTQPGPQQQPQSGGAAPAASGTHDLAVLDKLGRTQWRVLNLHKHGIGLRAEKGGGGPQGLRVLVVDLGPDVPFMQADIPPVAAAITVNGHGPLFFDPGFEGMLETSVPSAWLSTWSFNDVELRVWGPQGEELVDFTAALPGLL